MDWWKEYAKMFLNIAAIAVGVFIFGTINSPRWAWKPFILGWVILILLSVLSRILWKRGEK